ncbi:FRG domain-containing protein [Empedobacter falsenii]|uniref:FRG domain-containing protein n=1 Tax=Empedobacter falsenii TaxID=343874 RepID=UPI003A813ABB
MNSIKTVKSVSEFIDAINQFSDSIKWKYDKHNLWYRGESNKHLNSLLIPSLYRNFISPEKYRNEKIEGNDLSSIKTIENNLTSRFSTSASSYINSVNFEKSKWNYYYLMQHYGISTRLLDWSENALTALFFAVEKEDEENDSIVWMLNPYSMNAWVLTQFEDQTPPDNSRHQIFCPYETEPTELYNKDKKVIVKELARQYLDMDYMLENTYYPIAILPHLFDIRMKQQKSCFTLFGNSVNGFLNNVKSINFMVKIKVDKEYVKSIKEELFWLGINNESVYPGLDGIAKDVMYEERRKVNEQNKI